jgi:hypothetical protein
MIDGTVTTMRNPSPSLSKKKKKKERNLGA